MKKAALLIGLLTGILATFFVFFLSRKLIKVSHLFFGSGILAPFDFISLVIAPLGLMVGGLLTGFLCQPYIRNTVKNYLLLSPGLYWAFCLISFDVLYPLLWQTESSGLEGYEIFSSVIWILSSLFGTYLGSRIRAKKRCKPRRQEQKTLKP